MVIMAAIDKWMSDFQELMVKQSVKTLAPTSSTKKSEPNVSSFKLKDKYPGTHQCFLECRFSALDQDESVKELEQNVARIVVQFYDKDQEQCAQVFELFQKLPLDAGLNLRQNNTKTRIYITKQNLPELDKAKAIAEQDAEVRLYCQACSALKRAWKVCLTPSVTLT
jgi:hypothetical protein